MSATQYDTLDNPSLHALAAAAMAQYPAAYQGQLSLLCRSENATFLVKAGARRYALRLHRGGYHRKQDIESELDWLAALTEAGMAVPQAILSEEGERVLTLAVPAQTPRHAVLFHWIEGVMPTSAVDPKAFGQLGAITAKLHQHARQWQKPPAFSRILWDHSTMVSDQAHWGRWQDAVNLQKADWPVIEAALARIESELADYGKASDRFGLIHADLRLTNLLLHQGQTRVIDFDDCGFGWYMHDLAAALSFEEHQPNARYWVEAWLEGYQQHASISDADIAILPSLIAQRRIQMLAWTGSHADTEQTRSLGPDWALHSLRLLRRYLEQAQLPVGC
ncbi:phosphotransferase enzyme family protein [Gallaecimonas mangrovi]|uniref:phosphotransferase enzyme family protein n=1 Tax=Gallaecimonas mangrovi TaxID=2291597 RepID=UPI000E202FDF|nr:phosphotransferase [Gallaecimonas mangrovi]